jgi:hypothetical protein
MGSMARGNRCDRFVEEFNADAKRLFSMEDFPCFKSQSLGMSDSEEVVRMYVRLAHREHEEELCMETVFFDPEEQDEHTISRVCDLLKLEEDEAKKRLKRARLVG